MATSQTGRKSFFQRIRGKDESINEEMSFMDHVEALRWHLMRGVIVWLAAAIGIFVFIDWIFDNVIYAPARPSFVTYSLLCNWSHKLGLGDALCMPPVNIPLQGNTVSGPFMSAINIAMVGGIIVAFPYLFWELWRFIKPALSPKEVRYARGSILWVSLCFFIGAAFGYFLLAPFTFNFLANFTLGTVGAYKYMPTLDDYIDTLNNIILGCGIAFELPVLAYVLGKIGLITAGFLKRYRKYAFVIILIIAAIITPSPDWSSQTIVALPLLLLYEISVVIVARIDKQKAREEKEWS
ncbi:MAG TPA: twin-arginine translocase subunit TatC [Ferruginibacter sp.]|mgnify:FL=1|jgi:sec-independent protein translocase protein TatC|nr:twin-arginine translocase subunit TatC [Ferruginibacter sp.]TXI81374.1 MAG: twin-arginine translocase subunit TatC [Crocinitomicaceae bacterium]HNF03325.1 twin-arginine translocase subunit TatC [Ferruginibacter sp.]HNG63794.1 twin-arginine translocase subunit TatC [Ferruginibacter sp.]HQQ99695.1 twin-arginine translocase subunit TatC [Ferruginibacter sp.]